MSWISQLSLKCLTNIYFLFTYMWVVCLLWAGCRLANGSAGFPGACVVLFLLQTKGRSQFRACFPHSVKREQKILNQTTKLHGMFQVRCSITSIYFPLAKAYHMATPTVNNVYVNASLTECIGKSYPGQHVGVYVQSSYREERTIENNHLSLSLQRL